MSQFFIVDVSIMLRFLKGPFTVRFLRNIIIITLNYSIRICLRISYRINTFQKTLPLL